MRLARVFVLLAASLVGVPSGAKGGTGPRIVSARYEMPTARYDHGILGDALEWGALRLSLADGRSVLLRLPKTRVFEDTAPRLVNLKGREGPLVMVVETDLARGARLALFGPAGVVAATPFIGRPHRWLAPVGVADLDGDGQTEIAYVDRPHLAKRLRVWRFVAEGADRARLAEVAMLDGVSNHRIGWSFIPGGIRRCGPRTEMILASGDWRQVLAITLEDGALHPRPLGPWRSPDDLDRALRCPG